MALVLPETAEEADIRNLMQEAEVKCQELDVRIAGGQTRISGAVKSAVAVVTGHGLPFEAGEAGSADSEPEGRRHSGRLLPGRILW